MEVKKMKLGKLGEIGATIGAATIVGLNALQRKHKEEELKKSHFKPRHIVLYSSLVAAGLALWRMSRHHHSAA